MDRETQKVVGSDFEYSCLFWFGRAEGHSICEIQAKKEGQLVAPQPLCTSKFSH